VDGTSLDRAALADGPVQRAALATQQRTGALFVVVTDDDLEIPLEAHGLAVFVVSSSRLADLASRTAASIRDDAAAWRRTELPARARVAYPELDDDRAVAAWEAAAWGTET
ncbi:hypothetical protein IAE22_33165, partial [Bacillus sp. S34]|nr:hypothetical protein [Bacillus sp. S34]